MTQKYDLIIMGGGAAAFAAANKANQLKKKTLMINDSGMLPLGGTCVNVGCVPSKIMLHQGAEFFYPTQSAFRGVAIEGKADFVTALQETREMIEGFREKNYSSVIQQQEHIDFYEGRARFIDPHTVAVGTEQFQADYILISTGASTYVPDIKGLDEIDYLTNVNVFELTHQPKSVIIYGAGPQGLEFAQIFRHFGTEVTLLQRSNQILSKYDPLIGEELRKHLEDEGITIYTGVTVREFVKTQDGISVEIEIKGKGPTEISGDSLFLGTGLDPNTHAILADIGNVELDTRGFVKVDDYLQTSSNHIYAAGDVTGLFPLETVAAKQGSVAVRNMFDDAGATINYREIPKTVFTSPEVAVVGLTEDEYMEQHGTCLCSTIRLDHVEKALAIKDVRGAIKMVLNHETKEVVGVHIVSPMAADIITAAVYAIRGKMTIDDIIDTVHVFPTMSEMLKKVAQSFNQDLDAMACCVE